MAVQTIIPTVIVSKRFHAVNKNSLETFAAKLLDKIINAPSPAAIERYIAVAVKTLGNKKVNGYIIQRFLDRVSAYLVSQVPANEQQVINKQFAQDRLQQFRQKLAMPVGK